MSHVNEYQDGPYRMLELREASTETAVRICPERGGIAISYAPGGKEVFYLDRATFLDPNANIRGGNPVLFPISGQLADGAYKWEGKRYAMKNHGLARISPWTVEETGVAASGEPYTVLSLASTADMLASYPFAFKLVFTYRIQKGALVIEQEYRNLSGERMPVYPGFHPYFAAREKDLVYETDATRYMDYNDGAVKPFTGRLDVSSMKEAAALLDAKEPRIAFRLPGLGRKIEMEYSGQFRYVVIWTVPGADFVCVEPWMALTGELNRGGELVWIEPGETLSARLVIRAEHEGFPGAQL
ncbi:aldose epimerase [Paenibacillus sp. YN15]|uniref:aldose epimerase family protein n=1 Tax=Paenibacillus sp. YN15 TaxID=1742774 RepID=UPI000DCB4C48|nr:aldose epimerase [Paenibacillus sp. YN15]RAU96541.1 aldose epimerase [Paenibacillus sp. YN15]